MTYNDIYELIDYAFQFLQCAAVYSVAMPPGITHFVCDRFPRLPLDILRVKKRLLLVVLQRFEVLHDVDTHRPRFRQFFLKFRFAFGKHDSKPRQFVVLAGTFRRSVKVYMQTLRVRPDPFDFRLKYSHPCFECLVLFQVFPCRYSHLSALSPSSYGFGSGCHASMSVSSYTTSPHSSSLRYQHFPLTLRFGIIGLP